MPNTHNQSPQDYQLDRSDQTNSLTPEQTVVEAEETTSIENDFLPLIGVLGVVAILVGFFLFGNGVSFSLIALTSIAIFAIPLCYRYPRQGLWAFLIYLPFSGTISYWVGNDHFTFHLAKDGFYLPALIGLIQELRQKKRPLIVLPQLNIPFLIFLTIVLLTLVGVNGIQQFKTQGNESPLLIGIFGLKVLIGYIPLITCAYYLIESRRELHFFTRLQVILILICCTLGLIQFTLVVSGYCPDNTGLAQNLLLRANVQRKCLVGGALGYFPAENFIRLPGTFVAPWHWAWFLIASTFFSFATAFSDPKFYWRLTGLTALSLVMVNAIICGQRTAMLAVPLIMLILLVMTSHISRLKRLILILGVVVAFLITTHILFPEVITERLTSFIGRWNADPPLEFLKTQANFTIRQHRGWLGNGLGQATIAVRSLGQIRLIEAYYPKLLYEIGPLGVAAFLGLVTRITISGFKSYHQLKDHNLWGYGITFWIFICLISYNPYWYPLDTDPIAVYYWFTIGILFKLPKIHRQEREQNV